MSASPDSQGQLRPLVLIDGRSGAGKTQWATERARESGLAVLSLDDIYPGWDGLDAGAFRAFRDGIVPWARGEVGRLRTWDWSTGEPGGWLELDPGAGLIIEGCGALSGRSSPYATKRYWIEAEAQRRHRRVIERDGDTSAAHWRRWALQEDRFYAIHRSRDLADQVITT